MRTPLHAMVWELWRTSRLDMLLRAGGLIAITLLVYFSLLVAAQEFSGPLFQVCRGIAVIMLMTTSLISSTWLNRFDAQQTGFSFRLGFARPVSTTMLVIVPMVYTIVTSVIIFVLPAMLSNATFFRSVPIPLVGPASIVACAVTCLVAATWCPSTFFAKVIGLAGLAVVNSVSANMLHARSGTADPFLFAIGNPQFFDFGWLEYAALLIVAMAAFFVTVVAVDRQRHGDRWELAGTVTTKVAGLWNRPRAVVRPVAKPFTSRFAAQCWYEMRCFGHSVLLLGAVAPLVLLVLLSILPYAARPGSGWENSQAGWILALVFCPLVYQIAGVNGALGLSRKQGASRLPAFDATRSMPNDQLVAIKLVVIAACSTIGWLCMGLAAGLHSYLAGDWQMWVRIGELASRAVGDVPFYWWIAGTSNIVLLYISSSSILFAFALWMLLYPRVFPSIFAFVFPNIILAIWDAKHGWSLWYLWTAYGYVLAVVTVVVCVFMLWKALAAGFLGKRFFAGAFCLWVIYVSSTIALYIATAPVIAIPPVAIVLTCSMLLVPLATTAAAPLALASYRHA